MSFSLGKTCKCIYYKITSQSDGEPDPFDEWVFKPDDATVEIQQMNLKSFTYDALLVPDTTQEECYEQVGKDTISEYMNGFNATIFAYGQSGSGKTFSMVGPDEINDQLALDFQQIPEKIQGLFGIIPRGTLQIFETINTLVTHGNEYQVTCSYVEIYMEDITCLLNLKTKLKIKEYPDGNIEIDGIEKVVTNAPEVLYL